VSIRYAVLALVAEAPSHGYAIRAAFEDRLGEFWELNYGQIYQVLTVLEQEALITGNDERIGKRPVRRKYSISAKGREALRRWIAHPPPKDRPFRDDFYVRLMFAVGQGTDAVRSVIDEQIRCCRKKLALLADNRTAETPHDTEISVSELFTRAAFLHAQADLEALNLCRSAFATETSRSAPARSVAGVGPDAPRLRKRA
jgi:DNA-binding PadR family transcriptional regulator